jgi:hypothetical protein
VLKTSIVSLIPEAELIGMRFCQMKADAALLLKFYYILHTSFFTRVPIVIIARKGELTKYSSKNVTFVIYK